MPALMLPKRKVARHQRRSHRRELRRPQILRAHQPVHRSCRNLGQKHPARIGPCIAVGVGVAIAHVGSSTDKQRSRSTQRNQFVIIHGQVARIEWPRIP